MSLFSMFSAIRIALPLRLNMKRVLASYFIYHFESPVSFTFPVCRSTHRLDFYRCEPLFSAKNQLSVCPLFHTVLLRFPE